MIKHIASTTPVDDAFIHFVITLDARMNTAMKKLILALITTLLGVLSSGAMAASTYNATVNGTNYDFTYVTGSFNANAALLQSQPWWGSNQDTATTFATVVGGSLGYPNFFAGPLFAFGNTGNRIDAIYFERSASYTNAIRDSNTYSYAVATASSAGVPEIDGALVPQVGFLFGCLFLMFGRKMQDLAPALTA